ncbi:MAG: FG-GAP-like repeat-containing protein, partial [Myxococcota bacterium]
FDGDGWTDVIGATDEGGCHLHFMKNRGEDADGVHLGFTNGEDEGLYDEHIVGTCVGSNDFTCAHVAAGNFNNDVPDGEPQRVDFFYAQTNCRGNGRAANVRIYRNLGNNANGIPTWDHNDDTDVFRDGRITTYKNYMPFKGFDWNDDGFDDIVAVAGWDNTSEFQVYLARTDNVNDIYFEEKLVVIPDLDARKPMANDTQRPANNCTGRSHGPSGFGLADFNDDGFLDLIFGSVTSDFLTYWRGVDADNFVKVGTIPYPEGSVTFFNAADMDDDGDVDIVMGRDGFTCGGRGGYTYMYPNDGEGNFTLATRRTIIDYGHDYDSGLVFDFTNDGLPDVIASDGNNIGEYSVAINGTGSVFSLEGQAFSQPDASLVGNGEVLTSIQMTAFDRGCVQDIECNEDENLAVFVSNDAGTTWERLSEDELPDAGGPGEPHAFTSFGSVFQWRIDFTAQEDVLTGDDEAYAPASKESPVVRDVEFQSFKIPKFSFSRSAAELADLVVDSSGERKEYIYSASFKFPGFEAELQAIDVSDVGDTTSTRELERVNEFDGTGVVWQAGTALQTRSDPRTVYTAHDSDGDGVINDRLVFETEGAPVLAGLMELTEDASKEIIGYVRNGFDNVDGYKFYNPGHSSPVFARAPLPVGTDLDGEPGADGDEVAQIMSGLGVAYGSYATDAGNPDSYRVFLEGLRDRNVPPMVFIGANDGMVHAFNAITGVEEWGFIPHNLLSKLKTTRRSVVDDDG